MSWDHWHTRSEELSAEADAAARSGAREIAEDLYRQAGAAEARALDFLAEDSKRTKGITAVSSVALSYKGRDYDEAERRAYGLLAAGSLLPFAQNQLRDLIQLVWGARSAASSGIKFVAGDVLVSVRGGQVIHGGAPLDLIVQKVEGIQAILFRTVELLLDRTFRTRGTAGADLQAMFRPWLFQAPPGSYQFAVRVQEPDQGQLWAEDRPKVANVTTTFFNVLRASALDPEYELPKVVRDPQYQRAFLNLARKLAPTGKVFEYLEVRDAGVPGGNVALFGAESRKQLNTALRRARPAGVEMSTDEPVELRGILRALHLDQDWLEISSNDDPSVHLRVDEAGEALDDVVGSMVNRRVVVSAIRRGPRYLYRDIDTEE